MSRLAGREGYVGVTYKSRQNKGSFVFLVSVAQQNCPKCHSRIVPISAYYSVNVYTNHGKILKMFCFKGIGKSVEVNN